MEDPQPQLQTMAAKPVTLRSTVNYNQPSLPSLLTSYGFEDKATEEKKKGKEQEKEKRKEAKKQKKKPSSFDDTEDERTLLREKEKEEHYLKLIKDLYRLRDYYYSEYSSLLGDKVEKQRREIRQRDALEKSKQEKEEEEKRKASHTVQKRLERHTLETTPVTVNVPKSDIYHIVGLESKLRREGKLKTQSDYNKFREEMDEPLTFYRTFKVKKTSDPHSYPSSLADHQSTHSHGGESHAESQDNIFSMLPSTVMKDPPGQQRTLSRISESRESARGPGGDHWAITQQYPAVYKQKRRSLAPSRKSLVDERNDLDKRFPKLEMPKLHCFTMDLAKKPPDPEEVRQQTELRAREKLRKKTVRTYTKMYQLAMSNAAVSNRILDQHEDMGLIINGPDLCDVIADHHWMTAYGMREIVPQDQSSGEDGFPSMPSLPTTQPTTAQLEATTSQMEAAWPEDLQALEGSQPGSRQGSAGSKLRSQQSSKAGSRKTSPGPQMPMIEPAPPSQMPLTMNEITNKCSIVEAKTLSTLWNNYLRAGK